MSGNTIKILVLGAAGYLGGVIVDGLLKHPKASQFEITAFQRSEEKAKKLEAAGLGLKAAHGPLSALTEAVANSAVVFNVASSDNLPMLEAIFDGAKKRFAATKTPLILIHTSGSAIVSDTAMGQYASERVYDDLKDSEYLENIPVTVIHRNVDIAIANAHKEGYLKGYVVCPPLIWGVATGKLVDAGLQNPVTSGILVISRIIKQRGKVGLAGPQLNIWSAIEVHDLADLHLVIYNAVVLEGKEIAGGSKYYFAANGDVVTGDWIPKLAQALHKYGALPSAEIDQLTPEDFQKWPILGAFAVNSRISDARSRSLGWTPRPDKTGQAFPDSIDENIKIMVTQSDDFGASWGSPNSAPEGLRGLSA